MYGIRSILFQVMATIEVWVQVFKNNGDEDSQLTAIDDVPTNAIIDVFKKIAKKQLELPCAANRVMVRTEYYGENQSPLKRVNELQSSSTKPIALVLPEDKGI